MPDTCTSEIIHQLATVYWEQEMDTAESAALFAEHPITWLTRFGQQVADAILSEDQQQPDRNVQNT